MTCYRVTYPDGMSATVALRWMAENLVSLFHGTIDEIPGAMDDRDSDPMLDRYMAADEAWDKHVDWYNGGRGGEPESEDVKI